MVPSNPDTEELFDLTDYGLIKELIWEMPDLFFFSPDSANPFILNTYNIFRL